MRGTAMTRALGGLCGKGRYWFGVGAVECSEQSDEALALGTEFVGGCF